MTPDLFSGRVRSLAYGRDVINEPPHDHKMVQLCTAVINTRTERKGPGVIFCADSERSAAVFVTAFHTAFSHIL